MSTEAPKTVYAFAEKFRHDVSAKDFMVGEKPDVSKVVAAISEWIALNREALLLAWFAQYGFEPGKAVLEERCTLEGLTLRIREATPEELGQA